MLTSFPPGHRALAILGAAFLAARCSGEPASPTPLPREPPRVSCPAPVTVVSATGSSRNVEYGSASTVNGEPPVTTSCIPASGTVFPLGVTEVTCTATDARQRTDTCAFAVRVQRPAEIGLTRFLAFGDSITLGEDGNPLAGLRQLDDMLTVPSQVLFGREYPTVLRTLLSARYLLQTIVMFNEGRPGERAGGPLGADTLNRFRDVLGRRLPQVVLIMEGTNDISGGTGGNPPGIPGAISGLRSMIQAARARNVRPYLATVPPMDPAGERGRQGYATVPLLNAQIASLAAAEGVTLVDVHAAFNGNLSYLSSDGLHPNAAGLGLIADAFFATLQATLEVSPPTLGE